MSARNRPRSVNATNALCTIISQCAGLVVRRTSTPPTSDPTPMPIRMIVSSSENTARNPPNSKVKCRNHRISIPSAAKPDRPSARLVHMTASPPDRPPAAMSVLAGIIAAADGFRAEDALRLRESRDATAGADEAVPRDAPRASASAPTPAITLSATATIWVARRPAAGTSTKSVRKAPAAAPAVLTPYSAAIFQPAVSTSRRTRWRMSSVKVPPISSVTGVSRTKTIAPRDT